MARSRFLLALISVLLAACSQHRSKILNDGPDEAEEYYARKRSGTPDPQRAYALARAQMRRMQRFATAAEGLTGEPQGSPNLSWTFLGPGNIGGRTRTLVIDPTSSDVMYAGGVSGGIWKTVNAGARWEAIGDDLANLAVNSLVMDPRDPNVLYAGTGEGYFREEVRGTGLPLRGNGIFVTRDAGATWNQLASTQTSDFQWVNDLVISVHDSQRIYAGTRSGVWRSTDGGQQWKNVLPTTVTGGCLDLALRTDVQDGDYLFASCGTFAQATVYRTLHAENDGAWTTVLSEPAMGRTSLAIAPSRPSTIYALAADNDGHGKMSQGLLALFRSDANGDPGTWRARVRYDDPDRMNRMILTNLEDCGLANPTHTMGWYCNTIAVDPRDPERLFAGGVDLFRSDDGGRSWNVAANGDAATSDDPLPRVHADQHLLLFDPRYDGTSNQTLFVTNDGGVQRTSNARAPVSRRQSATCSSNSSVLFRTLVHNYGVTQFYHGAVFPDGRRFIGGAQDNNTLVGDVRSGPTWLQVIAGDGGYVAIDPVAPDFVYGESQRGNMFRSRDGGSHWSLLAQIQDDFLFVTPFTLDESHSTRIWIGGRRIWRSEDRGDHWQAASTTLSNQMSAIAVEPHRSDHVIAGTTDGAIYSTTNGTRSTSSTQWTRIQPRQGWVSSLNFDPTSTSIVYATYAGFGGPHVWRSIDGGSTWSPFDGSGPGALPDIPAHSLAIDPSRRDRLYLGTDLGVFVSSDGGAHWSVENTGFPAVVTEWVTIGQGESGPAIYAFTHGRGAWRADLAPTERRRAVRR